MSALLPLPPPPLPAHSGCPHSPTPETSSSRGTHLAFPQNSPENSPKRKPTVRARLSQLCKEGRPDLARRLFDALPRPVPTVLWNTLLIGYVCNAMPEAALLLYAHMNAARDAGSDAYTYSSALKACADARLLRLGKSIHCRIVRRYPRMPRNRVLNNSLLNMYANALDFPGIDVVEMLFDTMRNKNVVSWNTMFGWYVKTQRPLDALNRFKAMLEAGMSPSTVSFINVFPAVASVCDHKISNVLYGMLVKYGSEYVQDVFVTSSAIAMYSELSDISSARQVFDAAVRRNTEVWNTMIGGYVQNDIPEAALDLFVQVLGLDVVLADTVTYLAAVMAVSLLQVVQFGEQIHAFMVKKNLMTFPTILCNALMVMYSRCNSVQAAFELFHQMPERDIVSWNTMVTAFVQNGFNFEGLLLVYEMQKEGFDVDSVTITALLSAASNLRNIRIGKEAHSYLIRHGIRCEGMNSYLIDMYAKSGTVETARRLFDTDRCCERDQVTWNAMIAGYAQSGQLESAISIFRQMLEENQVPSSVTLSSILPAFSAVGGVRSGKEMHGFAIRNFLDKNIFVNTALVDMYSKCGGITYAEKVFNGMQEKNSVTYTTMISGLGMHGLGKRALSLFWKMQELGMKPDAVTFVAVMTACSYSGLVEEGLDFFYLMENELGIPASTEHYCCVVDMLGRAGRIKEAYDFVRELGEQGNSVGIWGSLLAACKMHGKLELGKRVAEKLFEIEKGNTHSGYHVLLSNVYAAEKSWENVDRIRKGMRARGLRKEPGFSLIKVGDAFHRFMSRDQHHPEHDQIKGMLDELSLPMKMAGYENVIPEFMDEISEPHE
ncbi:hypothetical protein Taro_031938 [Colocasia esculenta]|uniref:Pentatricopeptide repeat-containing protein n=1 Tax=Colocasia esculenta TaxID=4460 RepID=A0A843VRB8_COLES|nr:hypothetical protein [Colocasia esculenta]